MNPVMIVAELSANHNQSLEIAKKTIQAMADVGADAVKIQTYTADTITIKCDKRYFRIASGTIWDGMTLHQLYASAYTPWEWHDELKELAESLGMIFFSTPFDFTAIDYLESKHVPQYKIASFEITDIPLIKYAASKMKPMIISTGVATIDDIAEAVEACRSVGNHDITLLQCTSSYPAQPEDANLKTMLDMKNTFGVKVGLSDHSMGDEVACAAVALGAEIIEKHFILNRELGGPDASFSMEPQEFKRLVERIRITEKSIGRIKYITPSSCLNRIFARSIFVVKNIQQGEIFTEENIRSIRPAHGLPPKFLPEIIGRKASRDIEYGTPLSWEMII